MNKEPTESMFEADETRVKACIEGILFISENPVKTDEIAKAIGIGSQKVEKIISSLQQEYIDSNRGFLIRKIASGWRFYSNPAISEDLKAFVSSNIRSHLSRAALETLAIAAYKQPITRTQIAEIRGVRTDSVVLTLVDKGLLKEAGRLKEPGNPIIYKTTGRFLELLGINGLEQLPPIENLDDDQD